MLEELVDERFVSTKRGSLASDLEKAGIELGLQVTPFQHLSSASLFVSNDPLILHFASYGQLQTYDHWVLFLGMDEGKAKIVDSEVGELKMDLSEVMLRWDGIALAVHLDESPISNFAKAESVCIASWLTLFFSAGYLAYVLRNKFNRKLPIYCVIFLIFLTTSQIWNFNTYLFNRKSLQFANLSHDSKRFELVTDEEVPTFFARGNAGSKRGIVLLDARMSDDFARGHHPNSINVPVDTNQNEMREILNGIDRSNTVVIYCLSNRCEFDRIVAGKVSAEGFNDVRIYEPGWYGLVEKFEHINRRGK